MINTTFNFKVTLKRNNNISCWLASTIAPYCSGSYDISERIALLRIKKEWKGRGNVTLINVERIESILSVNSIDTLKHEHKLKF